MMNFDNNKNSDDATLLTIIILDGSINNDHQLRA